MRGECESEFFFWSTSQAADTGKAVGEIPTVPFLRCVCCFTCGFASVVLLACFCIWVATSYMAEVCVCVIVCDANH